MVLLFLFAANVGGVFLVLGFGCIFALIVAVFEFLWNVKKVAVEEKVSWVNEVLSVCSIKSDIKLGSAFRCSIGLSDMCIMKLQFMTVGKASIILSFQFQLTPWEALKAELLFAINISIVTKPVHSRLTESESPKSTSRSQKSRSRFGSEARSSLKEKSEHSVNLNLETNGFGSRSLSGLNRIGNFFGKKNSDE